MSAQPAWDEDDNVVRGPWERRLSEAPEPERREDFVSKARAAQFIGRTPRTIDNYIKYGRPPHKPPMPRFDPITGEGVWVEPWGPGGGKLFLLTGLAKWLFDQG